MTALYATLAIATILFNKVSSLLIGEASSLEAKTNVANPKVKMLKNAKKRFAKLSQPWGIPNESDVCNRSPVGLAVGKDVGGACG